MTRRGFAAAAFALLAACAGGAPERSASPAPGTEFADCAACPAMVVVPAGAFRMGADGGEAGRPEGPVREIRFAQAFAAGRTEVTRAQFARFVAEAGYAPARQCRTWNGREWLVEDGRDWRDPLPGYVPRDDDPVVCVSWRDAQAYAAWLARRTGRPYRLPTEAEWEYAARGGSTGTYPWGDDPDAGCAYANMYDASAARVWPFGWAPAGCDDGFPTLAPVGRLRPNGFGLYDTLGNAWEWTADCYVAPYPAGPLDGRAVEVAGACERRAVRGGSWMTRPDRHRLSFRGRDPEAAAFAYFGFRVVRDLERAGPS